MNEELFKPGEILICIEETNFIKKGEFVRFKAYSSSPFIEINEKPGHYGKEKFRRPTTEELWSGLNNCLNH